MEQIEVEEIEDEEKKRRQQTFKVKEEETRFVESFPVPNPALIHASVPDPYFEMQKQEGMVTSHGSHQAGRVLDHFMRWTEGAVASKMRRKLFSVTDTALVMEKSAEMSAAKAGSVLTSAERRQCGLR